METIEMPIDLVKYDKDRADEIFHRNPNLLTKNLSAREFSFPVALYEDNRIIAGYFRVVAHYRDNKDIINVMYFHKRIPSLREIYTREELGRSAVKLRNNGYSWKRISLLMRLSIRTLQRYVKKIS